MKLDGILSMSPFYFTASCAEHAAVDSSRSQRLPIERRAARIRSADSRTWRGRTAYLERFIHSEIYKAHPEVRAVVHSHSPAVIPFGVVGVALRPIFHLGGFLGAGVPVFEIRDTGGAAPAQSKSMPVDYASIPPSVIR